MTPISSQAGLVRYVDLVVVRFSYVVRYHGGGAPPSSSVRNRLVGGTYMAGKIKFQIWHLFILVPKFYCFYIKPNVFVTKKFLKFKTIFNSKSFKKV